MGRYLREEDEADKWLREHDPYYTSSDKNKRYKENYSYETPKQEARRRDMELPFSSLSLKQSKELDI